MYLETIYVLRKEKGFGSWSLDKRERLMFAAVLVAEMYSDSNDRV